MNILTTRYLRTEAIREHTAKLIASLKIIPKKPFRIRIDQEKECKTERQLGYFWGFVLPVFAKHTGMDKMGMYEDLLEAFAPRIIYLSKCREKHRIVRISEMDSEQMSLFIDAVIMEAASQGCVIPDSDPFWSTT